ncbi:hypothetical protein [Bosea sp. 685]|uniref:hypothetical protein n=1 Tax=Bosea sp. 685 TaxID=3080057 RepID=UPI002893045C|nr:hypothetical protein [Bosea sp. 685]WNJ88478.1 hypothetical protein RMR04_18915 [Bosea sp. 685]
MKTMARGSPEIKAVVAVLRMLAAAIALAVALIALPFRAIGLLNNRRERRFALARAEAEAGQKRIFLMRHYQDSTLVDALMAGEIWHDMTREQLLQSWGEPVEIEEKALKTKIRHVYKYDRIGVGRFARRVTLDNDRVTGWER